MEYKYSKYTFDDFLQDDYFLESIYNPTPESDTFWEELINAQIIDRDEFEKAQDFILQLNEEDESDDLIDGRIPHIWERIEKTNTSIVRKRRLKLILMGISAAAIFTLIFISTREWFSDNNRQVATIEESATKYHTEITDEIQLISSNNQHSIAGDSATIDYSQKDKIVINEDIVDTKSQEVAYNQLIVPYGKRSSIILSDGSKIWVNAGSKVTYPDKFTDKQREIYVEGEIYADIESDRNRPFIVKTKDINVKVLGTEFNVAAYNNDKTHSVILVEGSVQILSKNSKDKDKKIILKPNQGFFISDNTSHIGRVDVSNYISWKNGYTSFRNEKLGIILNRLSKYYGVTITCDPEVSNFRFSGGLDLKENIEQVLKGICNVAAVKYEKENENYIFSVNK